MRLHIEPVVPPLPADAEFDTALHPQGMFWWRSKSWPDHVTLRKTRRPGDPLDGGVVERVEAKQAEAFTEEHAIAAGYGGVCAMELILRPPDFSWWWLYWLRED